MKAHFTIDKNSMSLNLNMLFYIISKVNHALTRHVLSRGQLLWKHGTMVSIMWKQSDIKFPVDANISLDLYYPQVRRNIYFIILL